MQSDTDTENFTVVNLRIRFLANFSNLPHFRKTTLALTDSGTEAEAAEREISKGGCLGDDGDGAATTPGKTL